MTLLQLVRDLVVVIIVFVALIGFGSAIAWRIARSRWEMD